MTETPDGCVLYFSDAGAGMITALDTGDWTQILTIETSGGAGEQRCSPDGAWLIAAGGSGGNLLVIGQ
jgi:hypothetical protein